MNRFVLNGIFWNIGFVDPLSPLLVDRTGNRTVATTDPITNCVYLSDELHGSFLTRVLVHELGHCVILSFNLTEDIHKAVYPEYWIDAEEWVCNLLAYYGMKIFSIAYAVVGNNAWEFIPYELEKLIA